MLENMIVKHIFLFSCSSWYNLLLLLLYGSSIWAQSCNYDLVCLWMVLLCLSCYLREVTEDLHMTAWYMLFCLSQVKLIYANPTVSIFGWHGVFKLPSLWAQSVTVTDLCHWQQCYIVWKMAVGSNWINWIKKGKTWHSKSKLHRTHCTGGSHWLKAFWQRGHSSVFWCFLTLQSSFYNESSGVAWLRYFPAFIRQTWGMGDDAQ